MENLSGVYEGRIVSLGDGNASAFVPLVFGDTTIVISDFLGTPVVGRGWVSFQAGDPEHPVWLSGAFSSDGGGEVVPTDDKTGFTFSQDDVPTATAIGQTWYETDTGHSYVWVDDGTSTQWVMFAPGPGGGSGGSGGTQVLAYVHDQGSVASVWTVNHNLGWYPNVTVIDSAGGTVEGDVAHTTTNQLRLTFSGGFTGKAYLS